MSEFKPLLNLQNRCNPISAKIYMIPFPQYKNYFFSKLNNLLNYTQKINYIFCVLFPNKFFPQIYIL